MSATSTSLSCRYRSGFLRPFCSAGRSAQARRSVCRSGTATSSSGAGRRASITTAYCRSRRRITRSPARIASTSHCARPPEVFPRTRMPPRGTGACAQQLPEVDLQRLFVDFFRNVREQLLLRAEVLHAALNQVVDLFHAVDGALAVGRAQILLVREDAHAGHDAIPGKDRITPTDLLPADFRGNALARHPKSVQPPQRIGQVLVLRVGAPVIGVGPRVGLVMGDDVIARFLEMIVYPLIEFVLRGFAHVA